MKMIRFVAIVLTLIMAFSMSSFAEEMNENRLVVGHTTAMNGHFTASMWGNNTADLDVKALVNGYHLIQWNSPDYNFQANSTVVDELTIYDDAQGNRTYLFALCHDLQYSDGTVINAKDYAFSILLSVAEEIRQLGGNTEQYEAILGMEDYKAGRSNALAGVRVYADDLLAITISAEYRPFFYEMGLLMCDPMPIHVIAPGCQIKDDGDGVYIDGFFTADLLRITMLDPATGYLSHPSVVSGPYRLVSFDGVTAEFVVNPLYKGNENGQKPTIEELVFTLADNETMVDKLAAGEFDLLNKVTYKDCIDAGVALSTNGSHGLQTYPRTGQSYVAFCCERPAVQSKAVRQAIAHCMDKDRLIEGYAGRYGVRVDGYYGLGQWMYLIATGMQEADRAIVDAQTATALKDVNLNGVKVYGLDLNEAKRLLVEDGWTLNESGNEFVDGVDTVRCKQIEGVLTPLKLTLIYPEGNTIAAGLQEYFAKNLAQVGIQLTLEPVEFTRLLDRKDRREERDCDMIYMASNFTVVFDPAASFDPADAQTGYSNYTGIADEGLYQSAKDMSATVPGDILGYMTKWVAFQENYAEVLPAIPLYSNVYMDFYTNALTDYQVKENVTWSQAIVEAQLETVVPQEQ